MEESKFTAVQSWNVKTGLSHESEQTDCLQGNSLAAGVWTGDNKQIKFITQTDIDWNDFFLVDQGMTCFFEVDASFIIKDRFACIHFHRKRCSCKNKVQLNHQFKIE